jgi:hypothetical protein
MASKFEQYRQHAKEAQRQAGIAKDENEKKNWLWLAQGWLNLLIFRKPSSEQSFEAPVSTTETTQQKSDAPH